MGLLRALLLIFLTADWQQETGTTRMPRVAVIAFDC
jgi:hypothetical protein